MNETASQGRKVLIIGATSAIAQETAKHLAAGSARIVLVARSLEKMQSVALDLKARGASAIDMITADLDDFSKHAAIIEKARSVLQEIDVVLIAHGILGDHEMAKTTYTEAERIIRVNFLSYVSLLTPIATEMELRGSGQIVVISSVAGDRGRQSNYFYGCAKGGLSVFLQGLRNRLARRGVQVLTVKPGFVDTPMTVHFKKNALFATPQRVGAIIARAMEKGKDEIYVPWFWWGIMAIIKAIPERIFKRLGL